MPENTQPSSRPRVAAAGALYPIARRGLAADLSAAAALGLEALPVCTALSMATPERVSDFVEVPEDAVRSQLEHLESGAPPDGIKIGVLAQHGTAEAVLDWARKRDRPIVLDLQVSGPAGETVLSRRGLEEVFDRLEVPDILLVDRTDAELLSGGEIRSLDDAQVAVQRIVRRGARSVLIKVGRVPARHFEVETAGDGSPSEFASDLFYDGVEFALFEAPWVEGAYAAGASCFHALSLLRGLIEGSDMEAALRDAKAFVTETLRTAE